MYDDHRLVAFRRRGDVADGKKRPRIARQPVEPVEKHRVARIPQHRPRPDFGGVVGLPLGGDEIAFDDEPAHNLHGAYLCERAAVDVVVCVSLRNPVERGNVSRHKELRAHDDRKVVSCRERAGNIGEIPDVAREHVRKSRRPRLGERLERHFPGEDVHHRVKLDLARLPAADYHPLVSARHPQVRGSAGE